MLLTDDDVLDRVAQLIGRAAAGRQFWIMSVDGDGGSCPSPSRSPTCPAARSRARCAA